MFKFNPITGELDMVGSGYSGTLYDLSGNPLAEVVSGLIQSVYYTPPAVVYTMEDFYRAYVYTDGLQPIIY